MLNHKKNFQIKFYKIFLLYRPFTFSICYLKRVQGKNLVNALENKHNKIKNLEAKGFFYF